MTDPSNFDDIIVRIEELQEQEQQTRDEIDEDREEHDDKANQDLCSLCGLDRIDHASPGVDHAHTPFGPYEAPDPVVLNGTNYYGLDEDEAQELSTLLALAEQCEGYAPDWKHGETLIRDSYFETYAEQLAEDIGSVDRDAGWPGDCIDWEKAARELQQDYTEVDYDGVSYWIRCC